MELAIPSLRAILLCLFSLVLCYFITLYPLHYMTLTPFFPNLSAAIGSFRQCLCSSPCVHDDLITRTSCSQPLTQLIPTAWRDVPQPFESLDQVPDLSTIRFELDISLLVHQLNYITVTLDTLQLETKSYTVDDSQRCDLLPFGTAACSILHPQDSTSFPYRPLHTVAPR